MLGEIDPYTIYYPEQRRDELYQFVSGKYAGIGVGLRLNEATGRAQIVTIEKSGGAARAGLHIGDQLLSIDNNVIKKEKSSRRQNT